MIINSLANYYDQLAENGEITQRGWCMAKVSYGVPLDPDGNVLEIVSRMTADEKGKEKVASEQVPEQGKKTSGISANFLCDAAKYLLGVDENKEKRKRAEECFQASAKLHHEILDGVESDAAERILKHYDQWDPSTAYDLSMISSHLADFGKTGFLVFTDENGIPLYRDPAIREAWNQYRAAKQSGAEKAFCIDTGRINVPSVVHPSIKGIRGAQTSGAALVSFNFTAAESWGRDKSQGLNAPISEETAYKYTTVLNKMISGRDNIVYAGSKSDIAILFWAENANHACESVFEMSFEGESNEIKNKELKSIYSQLAHGGTFQLDGETGSYDNPFYVLGIAPNAARLSVRFFLQGKFGDMIRHLQEHNQRLEIVQPFDKHNGLPLWKLLQETVSATSTNAKISSQLEEQMLKAILMGGRYPVELLTSILTRIRAEHSLGLHDWEKAAMIKAYLLRNMSDKANTKEVATVSLNKDTNNEAYVLGRLFAVLEGLQRSSAGTKLNTTIRDRYFSSAAATPGIVFPQLISLAQNHMKKLEEGAKVYYDRQITELMGKLEGPRYPSNLDLAEQGEFYLGYYHQKQAMFTKKSDQDNSADQKEENDE